jgi:hypothetical protein
MTTEDAVQQVPPWTLVTSHGLVLLFVSSNPDATIRETAEAIGLTERRVAAVIRDLVAAGLLSVRRSGRRNHYTLNHKAHFRHPFLSGVPFRQFVSLWRKNRVKTKDGRGWAVAVTSLLEGLTLYLTNPMIP